MARCDQGYLCRVCGREVEDIIDSELYLRFVIGEIDPETLHTQSECHLRCNPVLSQFIDDERFSPPIDCDGPFSKAELDPTFVRLRAELCSRGYDRLWEIFTSEIPLTVVEYPLDAFRAKWS
jgi:hypothetical protein